ncbi:DUF3888 domain-containing protein [Sporosarcina highlanderae]|uniref:DUF3888 domain-containing protein n=1 Tax=Sporosarcina highlanderae TaxID=3035916 RepID=A0ABT8JNS9_9BACL|nr:DUF3888 domain-containing protein [Sporosarcina highlanderae]MDN4606463.1 DUF3888 domain-containing protein [Sporosarcina highlanderae]
MKKIYFLSILLVLTLLLQPLIPKANVSIDDPDSLEDALLVTLQPFISQGIIDFYGYDKPYRMHDAEVVKITREKKGSFAFIVEVRVKTFEAAENPPYGDETMRFGINSKGTKLLEFNHVGDEEEKKLKQFYKEVIIDIKKSLRLNLLPYEQYNYNQLRYKAEKNNEYDSLAHIAEEIVMNILSPEIQPPYKNVIDPVTFVKDDEGFILFKKADGTNFYYKVQKENGIWNVVEQGSEKGKKMDYELLWYM